MTKGTGQISFLETWLWNSEKISGNLQSIFVDFLPSRTQRTDQCKKSQGEPSYIMRFKGPLLWINQALFRYYYNLNHLSSLKQRLAGIWKMAPTNQNTYIFPIDSSQAIFSRTKNHRLSHSAYFRWWQIPCFRHEPVRPVLAFAEDPPEAIGDPWRVSEILMDQ